MKEYDVIAFGTGSSMNIVSAMLNMDQKIKAAVIDKDEPGGICLTRGCIPTKILLYPADVIRTIESAEKFGIDVEIKKVDFKKVMERMRSAIHEDIESIGRGLSGTENIDYYRERGEFVKPYTVKVGKEMLHSDLILLCTGSEPKILPIDGLDKAGYHTSDTILNIDRLPKSLAIIGGGYIAAEYGHFFSAMGSKVTIIGRNPQFLPQEEPEVSALAKRELGRYARIITDHEVRAVKRTMTGQKKLLAVNRRSGEKVTVAAEEILLAAGRVSNSDILKAERGGIKTDKNGWIVVNEYMETSQPNVWAFGDATGVHLFKHAANYESEIVFHNAILKRKRKVDHHAVPHAVFTHPEIAAVGMSQKEAEKEYGRENILIGFHKYEDTAKGGAMDVKDFFVKVILEGKSRTILGAHIIGPQASVLIQEIINLMYTKDRSARPLNDAMHIHPALPEVVERAFTSLMPPDHYQHILSHHH